jgi:hypothetical protein
VKNKEGRKKEGREIEGECRKKEGKPGKQHF